MSSKRITSAPSWASVMPPIGAAMNADPSMMRRPARMPVMFFPVASVALLASQRVFPLLQPPAIFRRPEFEVGIATQRLRGMQRPERLVEGLPPDRDQVGIARLQ